MNEDRAIEILENEVLSSSRQQMIRRLAFYPDRYVGVFRATNPKVKLIQNLLTSHEVLFGRALEVLIREIITDWGFTNYSNLSINNDRTTLAFDHLFTKENRLYMVEQKVRDDHDSTKKRGQIDNFKLKIGYLLPDFKGNLTAIMFFIDPALTKNRTFYSNEISQLTYKYDAEIKLLYGKEFFDYFGYLNTWTELTQWLSVWKNTLPDVPEIDFDQAPRKSFEELKLIPSNIWKKLIETKILWEDGIIRELFSNGSTFRMLFNYFSQLDQTSYYDVSNSLLIRINKYYY